MTPREMIEQEMNEYEMSEVRQHPYTSGGMFLRAAERVIAAKDAEIERWNVGIRELERRWSESRQDAEAAEQERDQKDSALTLCCAQLKGCEKDVDRLRKQLSTHRLNGGKCVCDDIIAVGQERDTLREKVRELNEQLYDADTERCDGCPDRYVEEQRDYRDRLDRMVAALCAHPAMAASPATTADEARALLAAIDAHIKREEERKP